MNSKSLVKATLATASVVALRVELTHQTTAFTNVETKKDIVTS